MPGLEVPFVLAVVELDEQPGLRLMPNIVDCRRGRRRSACRSRSPSWRAARRSSRSSGPSRMTERFEDALHHLRHRPVRRRPADDQGRDGADPRRRAGGDRRRRPASPPTSTASISWPGADLARRQPRAGRPGLLRPRPARGDRRAAPAAHLVLRRPRDARHVRRGDPRLHGGRHRHVPARARLSRAQRGHGLAHGHRARDHRRRWRHGRDAVDAPVRRLLRPELDGAVRDPAHARVRHDARAARGDRAQRRAATPSATRRRCCRAT